LELGRRIAALGREQFEREFRESIKKAHLKNQPPRTGIRAWPEEVRYAILVVLFGGMFLFLAKEGLAERFMVGVVPLVVMVALVYYGSVFFAVRRFNKWVDALIAAYAGHVARGGR
jgi:hypothetical protein